MAAGVDSFHKNVDQLIDVGGVIKFFIAHIFAAHPGQGGIVDQAPHELSHKHSNFHLRELALQMAREYGIKSLAVMGWAFFQRFEDRRRKLRLPWLVG